MDAQEVVRAAGLIGQGDVVALTGAGISVESGIPPFRGPGGLWEKYDPALFEIGRFRADPELIWKLLRQVFFADIARAAPNPAHLSLAAMERAGLLNGIVTQNIDALHQKAGSREVVEFHGGLDRLRCLECLADRPIADVSLEEGVPRCPRCGGVEKPDVIFFGEPIEPEVSRRAAGLAMGARTILIVGTTGQVMPAASLPYLAKEHGAKAIEINPHPSALTRLVTDVFIQAPAGAAMRAVIQELGI